MTQGAPAVDGLSLSLLRQAARLLSGPRRGDALALGDACVAAAAIASTSPDRHAARSRLRRVRAALRAGDNTDPVAAPFLALQSRYEFPTAMPDLLMTTLLRDLEYPVIETWNGLIRYCHGSGGSIGVMLCPILGGRSPEATPFAIDFGIAVRLVALARDVRQDAVAGSVYLPAALLPRSVTPHRLREGDKIAVTAAHTAATKLVKRATVHFHSATSGLPYVPPRSRAAVLVAMRHYQALAEAIIDADPEAWWREPPRLGTAGRVWRTVRTLAALGMEPRRRASAPARHLSVLHRPLVGLPGVPRPDQPPPNATGSDGSPGAPATSRTSR